MYNPHVIYHIYVGNEGGEESSPKEKYYENIKWKKKASFTQI